MALNCFLIRHSFIFSPNTARGRRAWLAARGGAGRGVLRLLCTFSSPCHVMSANPSKVCSGSYYVEPWHGVCEAKG